jgi:hypothetical protein
MSLTVQQAPSMGLLITDLELKQARRKFSRTALLFAKKSTPKANSPDDSVIVFFVCPLMNADGRI